MKFIRFFLILFTCSAFAQDNFVQGEVVINNGDTLKGEINYQDWKVTPEKIEFKSGGILRVFRVSDVKSFKVKGDRFISEKIKLDVTVQKLQRMNRTDKPRFTEKKVFLNVLEEGDVSLYEYYDSRPHYFAKKGNDLIELTNRAYLDDDNNLITNKKYLGQLSLLLNECSSVRISENLSYKRKELSKLIGKYNTCINPSLEGGYTKDLNRKTSHFYATAGFFASNLAIESRAITLKNFDGGSLSTPSIGVAYEIGISKNRQKWAMYTELVYNRYNQSYDNDKPSTSFVKYDPLKVDYSTIGLSVLFRYKFHKDKRKVTPFFNIGAGYSLIISNNTTVTKVNSFNGSEEPLPVEFRTSYFNIPVGVGVMYNKIALEIRYSVSDNFIFFTDKNNISNLGLMLSYRL
jgi:hypothetical protein